MLAPKTGSPQHRTPPTRSALSERPGTANIVRPSPQPGRKPRSNTISTISGASPVPSPLPSPLPSQAKKLRMQSPQKLRERLQNEQSYLTTTQNHIQDELLLIGDELTQTPTRTGSIRPKPLTIRSGGAIGTSSFAASTSTRPPSSHNNTADLTQRLLKLEAQLPSQIETVSARISAINADLASSLAVSENKARKLDELYRESNSENEALYARFNDELGRILKAVRSGDGVGELKRQVREQQEEVARLKRENGRLKRENVGLRAQMKE
jgi:post-segregation antitoxin (ccd killing protein)